MNERKKGERKGVKEKEKGKGKGKREGKRKKVDKRGNLFFISSFGSHRKLSITFLWKKYDSVSQNAP